MPIDYAKTRTHSRLKRSQQRRAIRTTLIFFIMMVGFAVLFGFLGINVLARLSLLLTRIRAPKPVSFNQDIMPPPAPQISLPFESTASAVISVNGYAEANSLVKLFLNGLESGAAAVSSDGLFNFPGVNLSPGLNRLYAVAQDANKNQSPHSPTFTVILDQTIPDLTLDNPADNAHFYGPTERLVTLAGATDPQARLSLNDQIVVVAADGNFQTVYELQEGSNPLLLVAIDPAGNQNQLSLTLNYSP